RSATMYCAGLRLEVISKFENHAGVDGVMVGRPGGGYHLEFTHSVAHDVRPTPTPEDLLVCYIPDPVEWDRTCHDMIAAGFTQVTSLNPYWERRGRTFVDPDGYRTVLERAEWGGAGAV